MNTDQQVNSLSSSLENKNFTCVTEGKEVKQVENLKFKVNGPPPFTTIGLFTFLRTYARRHEEDNPKSTIESWEETLTRVVLACNSQLNAGFTREEQQEIFDLFYNLKCSVAGRFLWQLGTKTVEQLGLPSLQNCCFTTINDPIKPFTWVMNFLMLGAGAGYRIMPEDVENFPIVKKVSLKRIDSKDADFIVPDSREGWIKLLGKLLKAHFYSGVSFTYSCMLLRSKGAPIKTFGGLASGPDVLCDGLDKINEVLNKRAGDKVRPIDCLDILNLIGQIIVSGNVRRSAQIALGSVHDLDYLRAKDWSSGNIPNHRAYSNNSIICNDIKEVLESEEFWKGYEGNGEPYGLINLDLSRKCGRIGDLRYPDPDVQGYNPCFSGDTLIAVADGRHMVSIRELAEEGKDIPVYSIDPKTYKISIQWGRNPRITGENKILLRIHIGKGEYLDVTEEHKFLTNDGRTVLAKDLKEGDSLPRFEKDIKSGYYYILNNGKRKSEHRMVAKFYKPEEFNKNFKEGEYKGACKTEGVVVHHKNENKLDNRIENLEITTFEEHNSHHGKAFAGENNPMFGKKHSEETKKKIGEKSKERWSDPTFIKKIADSVTDEHRKANSERMTRQKKEWDTKRVEQEKKDAIEADLEIDEESTTILYIFKTCENEKCGQRMRIPYNKREQGYCSISCGNTKPEAVESRAVSVRLAYELKLKPNFHAQVMLYKKMQKTQDKVLKKDFENKCKENRITVRFNPHTTNPYIAKSWKDFKKKADDYNHQVVRIEKLKGKHTVYNITVEKNHTLAVITKKTNSAFIGTFVFQCGEQSLSNAESCCLSEIFLPNQTSQSELFKSAMYLYRICKHSLTLPCSTSKETEVIVHKNMRMGIGISGYLQATEEQKSWLRPCYEYLRKFDVEYSKKHGFPTSVKLTTCKPSGTLSLLGNCTPGVHPGFSQYYKRRIRVASESPLLPIAREHGYHVEYSRKFDGTNDHSTQIVTFPMMFPEGTVLAKDCTAVKQLEYVKRLQTDWSDNAVSVTVYYKKQEIPEIKEWLKNNYNNNIKSVSFLLHNDHGFDQAPLEEITKEVYLEMVKKVRPIYDLAGICYTEDQLESDCQSGICPIK